MKEKVMGGAGSIHWRYLKWVRKFGLKTSHEAMLWKNEKMLTSQEHLAFGSRMD